MYIDIQWSDFIYFQDVIVFSNASNSNISSLTVEAFDADDESTMIPCNESSWNNSWIEQVVSCSETMKAKKIRLTFDLTDTTIEGGICKIGVFEATCNSTPAITENDKPDETLTIDLLLEDEKTI